MKKLNLGALGVLALIVVAVGASANSHASFRAVCPGAPVRDAHCHALIVTDEHGNPLATGSPTGLSPAAIQAAYGFPTDLTSGNGKTIGIVDAFDDPTAEADLGTFSSQFGLPACTTANGCFKKVDQTGGTTYPRSDSGWALEISLDIQWAHAIAPGAKILLVEASSNSFSNLMAAEDYAKTHAQYVSNSWGGSEFTGENLYDSHFAQSGVSFFVSAGDNGLPAEYPSASPNVISVGGTTLHFDTSGNFASETGWSGGGGGCSADETATSAQSSFSQYAQTGCNGSRATPDVALDADPSSGVSVYESPSWYQVGGTSASSPMWAARSADAGAVVNAAYVYGNSINFRDITTGSNGAPCLSGYDLCSGRGSWTSGSSSPGSLAFTSAPQTLTAGQPSSAIVVQVSPSQSTAVSVTLGSSSTTGTFSTQQGSGFSSTLTLSLTSSATFYYKDTQVGTPVLTASATGYTSASQTESVQAAPTSSMLVALSAGPASKKGSNSHVSLTASVTDSASHAPVAGAGVVLKVYPGSTCSGTPATTGSGTTGTGGTASFTFTTRQSGAMWCALATATHSGYSSASGSTTFRT